MNQPRSTFRLSWSASALLALVLGSCAGAVEESRAEPGGEGWEFTYPAHPGTSRGRIDLRMLNEPEAGRSGFVRLTPDGNGFVLGDGTPARFWAIGTEAFRDLQPAEMADHARFLAGLGVNMIRIHAQVAPKGPGSHLTDFDEKEVDGIWRLVAEAKKQGIYSTISPYWANGKDAANWGIEGYGGKGDLWGLLFFDETLQRGYKAWATALYSRKNPYTGIPLARDPAVAIIQIQNEDSLLFWTTANMKPAQKARLAAKYATWLAARYGSLGAARKSWGGAGLKEDDIAAGRVGLVGIYPMTISQSGDMARRVADEVAFLAATQRKFYTEMVAFYRDGLGCRQLLNASNWRTANQALLDDVERWTYGAADVIAVNRYYNGGAHSGPNVGWRIDPGDKFSQRSALSNPRELPLNLRQSAGHPMIVTESGWVNPLAFQAEGPFLEAVYLSLTGVDALYWFTASKVGYDLDPFFPHQQVRGQKPLMKWTMATPPILGSFPAAALIFRKGFIKPAEPVVHEERTLKALWDREPPLIAEDPAFDPNRDRARPDSPAQGAKASAVDPLAFLVGPVEVKHDGDPARTRVADLSRLIDRDKKRIQSATGEVVLDYGLGLCTVDAPRAQGACGFLAKAGLIRLKDLSIQSSNSYATVVAVAMDDLPLASSKRILVQVATAARPTGWATRDATFTDDAKKSHRGLEVVSTGKPPWRVADSEVGLALKNPGLTRATRLDPAGFPAGDVPIKKSPGGLTLTMPPDSLYVILE
jgi:hypothetical protein